MLHMLTNSHALSGKRQSPFNMRIYKTLNVTRCSSFLNQTIFSTQDPRTHTHTHTRRMKQGRTSDRHCEASSESLVDLEWQWRFSSTWNHLKLLDVFHSHQNRVTRKQYSTLPSATECRFFWRQKGTEIMRARHHRSWRGHYRPIPHKTLNAAISMQQMSSMLGWQTPLIVFLNYIWVRISIVPQHQIYTVSNEQQSLKIQTNRLITSCRCATDRQQVNTTNEYS